jgi:hypothetical protein
MTPAINLCKELLHALTRAPLYVWQGKGISASALGAIVLLYVGEITALAQTDTQLCSHIDRWHLGATGALTLRARSDRVNDVATSTAKVQGASVLHTVLQLPEHEGIYQLRQAGRKSACPVSQEQACWAQVVFVGCGTQHWLLPYAVAAPAPLTYICLQELPAPDIGAGADTSIWEAHHINLQGLPPTHMPGLPALTPAPAPCCR